MEMNFDCGPEAIDDNDWVEVVVVVAHEDCQFGDGDADSVSVVVAAKGLS